MMQPLHRYIISLLSIVILGMLIALFMNPEVLRNSPLMEQPNVQTFKTMFIGITLEAFPFIVLGVIISAILQVFIPDSFVQRIIPKHPVFGVMVASLLGIVFPICECGMVPVARRLVSKGFPLYAAVVFLLAGPIINPVVYSATYLAFRSNPAIAYSRMALAFAVASLVGLIIYKFLLTNPLKQLHTTEQHHHHSVEQKTTIGKLVQTFDHAASELFEMGKYLIFGAFITAVVQTFVPRRILIDVASSDWGSNIFMMGFAYILSICSTADAFVASSFATTFASSSLLAFLVFGPMLDLKSTLMLLSVCRAKFIVILTLLVAFLVGIGSSIIGFIID